MSCFFAVERRVELHNLATEGHPWGHSFLGLLKPACRVVVLFMNSESDIKIRCSYQFIFKVQELLIFPVSHSKTYFVLVIYKKPIFSFFFFALLVRLLWKIFFSSAKLAKTKVFATQFLRIYE